MDCYAIEQIIREYIGDRKVLIEFTSPTCSYRGDGPLMLFKLRDDGRRWLLRVTLRQDGKDVTYRSQNNPGMIETFRIDGYSIFSLINRKVMRLESLASDLSNDASKAKLIANDGTGIFADEYILRARSAVFAKMLPTESRRQNNKEVIMLCSLDALELLMAIIYVKPIDAGNLREHLAEVIRIVDVYQLGGVTRITGIDAKEIVTKETAIEMFLLAAKHKQPELLQFAFELIRANREELARSELWKEFVSEGADARGAILEAMVNAR